jgi:hypothetical protein
MSYRFEIFRNCGVPGGSGVPFKTIYKRLVALERWTHTFTLLATGGTDGYWMRVREVDHGLDFIISSPIVVSCQP